LPEISSRKEEQGKRGFSFSNTERINKAGQRGKKKESVSIFIEEGKKKSKKKISM